MNNQLLFERLNQRKDRDESFVQRVDIEDGYLFILKQVRDAIANNAALLKIRDTPSGIKEIKRLAEKMVFEHKDHLSSDERADRTGVTKRILDDIVGYGPIQDLLSNEEVSEIIIYNAKKIRYELNGKMFDSTITFRDEKHLNDVIERILRPLNISLSPSNPEANARLLDGSRVHILGKPVALDGPYGTIRKFRAALGLNDLVEKYKMLTSEIVEYYSMMMNLSKSFVISGGTGTGKTSHLNALSSLIPDVYDIITIEDIAELQLQQPHVRRIETQQKTSDSNFIYEMFDGIKSSLRMRPTIIIIGESRDGVTLFNAFKAFNTGHEGSGTTLHSNTLKEAVDRMINMILESYGNMSERAIVRGIRSSVQWMIQLKHDKRTGQRYVAEIGETEGIDERGEIQFRTIFRYNPKTKQTEYTGEKSLYVEEAEWSGIPVPSFFQEEIVA